MKESNLNLAKKLQKSKSGHHYLIHAINALYKVRKLGGEVKDISDLLLNIANELKKPSRKEREWLIKKIEELKTILKESSAELLL